MTHLFSFAVEIQARSAAMRAACRARTGRTEKAERSNRDELLRYAAGWIEDPGDWSAESDETLTIEDEEGSDGFGPTDHECPEPQITRKMCRWH